ncbi:MAG: hypothetical protein ACPGNV_06385 [Mangrovicoccus sp.]
MRRSEPWQNGLNQAFLIWFLGPFRHWKSIPNSRNIRCHAQMDFSQYLVFQGIIQAFQRIQGGFQILWAIGFNCSVKAFHAVLIEIFHCLANIPKGQKKPFVSWVDHFCAPNDLKAMPVYRRSL